MPAFCRSLQAAVKRATGLGCSVGAAPNKATAKIASDRDKPHGVTPVPPGVLLDFLDPLPVRLVGVRLSGFTAATGQCSLGRFGVISPSRTASPHA